MERQLVEVGVQYEIVEAVEGRNLDLSDYPQFALVSDHLRASSIGCALSHFKAQQKILDEGIDVGLVLEDDTLLPADLNGLTEEVAKYMHGAEAVLLYLHSFQTPVRLTMAGAEQLSGGRNLVHIMDEGTPRSSAAYLITREACERMLKIMQPVRAVADDWALFYHEHVFDRVRYVMPAPVLADPNLPSTLDYHRPGSPTRAVLDIIYRFKVPVAYQVLANRRKRISQQNIGGVDIADADSLGSLLLSRRDSAKS